MFCEAGGYTVIPFGYEKLVPELADNKRFPSAKKVIDNIRSSPDYVVILDNKTILLVEVKFKKTFENKWLIQIAEEQIERWNPSWIFIATFNKFYLSECSNIIKYKNIQELKESIIKKELQDKYLKLINEFEK